MENLQPSLILLFAFLLFLRIVMKKYQKKNSKLAQLPPGPWKLPFIGNLHQIALQILTYGSLPHCFLNVLAKKYGPVMHLQMGEVSVLVISSPEAAKEVMKVQDLIFADRPHLLLTKVLDTNRSDLFFSPYGDYWRQLRKICKLDLLASKRIKSFRSLREKEVANLVKSISSSIMENAPINLSKMILAFTLTINCGTTFGKKSNDEDEFVSAINEISKIGTGFDVIDTFPSHKYLHWISREVPQLEKLHAKTDRILDKVISAHKTKKEKRSLSTDGSGQEDLIDVLLRYHESSDLEFPITTSDIKAVIVGLFAAETVTSMATITWIMSELIKNPPIMEKVQAEVRHILKGKSTVDETDIQEMNYLKLVIKETLRLHPPLPMLVPRESREKCKFFDYDIPIKTKVFINVWAIGRDPKYWENPECFDPERFSDSPFDFTGKNFEYTPFGSGRRMCPGVSFGIANLELPLTQLLYHFDWKIADGTKPEELDMSEVWGLTVTKEKDLILNAIPYTP